MKMFISFLMAAILIGFALFTILFWLFKMEYSNSMVTAFSGALAAFVVDYVKERRKRKLKDIEA